MEADLVAPCQIPYTEISAAGVHGVGLRALPGNLVKLLRGYSESKRILREFNPDVMLFTGGYVAVPMALAGKKHRSLLYVPDIEPGLALKALARTADVIALSAESSKAFFKPVRRMVVTGYPTRSDLIRIAREEALKTFDLFADLPVLLVIGGSKGAHSLNQAIFDNLPTLLQRVQVLHVTGQLDNQIAMKMKENLSAPLGVRYIPYAFLHKEISAAYSAASVVLSRAGASTLGELPLFGLPAILVPYPYAWRYQKVNADYLVSHNAAICIENAELSAKLVSVLDDILTDQEKLASMSANMHSLATPAAAAKIADLLLELGNREEGLK